jgi:hypothetical protein
MRLDVFGRPGDGMPVADIWRKAGISRATYFIGKEVRRPAACSEPRKLDRFWLESPAPMSRLGGAQSNEGLEVFGRPVTAPARR